MNLHFVTYGDDLFVKSRERICLEAKQTGWFSSVKYFDENSLSEGFKRNFMDKITGNNNKFYIWKFGVILQALDSIKEGDVLVYADAGCTINDTGKDRFNEYIEALTHHSDGYGILMFISCWKEKDYTNKKLFEYFGIDYRYSLIANTGQCIATSMIFRKNAHAYKIIHECLKLLKSDPSLISDYYNEENEVHRRDQSIFSIVTKLYGAIIFSDDTYNHPLIVGEQKSSTFPIIATRLRV